jgi:hypothetical protein
MKNTAYIRNISSPRCQMLTPRHGKGAYVGCDEAARLADRALLLEGI